MLLDCLLYTTPSEEVDVLDRHVWQLIKSIYGLKQAAQLWNQTLHEAMTNIGLKRSPADTGLYIRNKGLAVGVHVDDLIRKAADSSTLDWLTKKLRQ
jgi:hypothetical protein